MTACGAIGALMVGGVVVGQLRCDREDGHEIGPFPRDVTPEDSRGLVCIIQTGATPHRAVLEWAPEHEVDLALFDPDESFDVDVPFG